MVADGLWKKLRTVQTPEGGERVHLSGNRSFQAMEEQVKGCGIELNSKLEETQIGPVAEIELGRSRR